MFHNLVSMGDTAFRSGELERAETFYKRALHFSKLEWGPYHWTEASVSLSLHFLYLELGRDLEAELAYMLCTKILASYGSEL